MFRIKESVGLEIIEIRFYVVFIVCKIGKLSNFFEFLLFFYRMGEVNIIIDI